MPGRKAPETERRAQIMRAAFEVAARDGLEGLTVRKVATRARLSSGLVLFHFSTKEQLIVALLDWVLATTTVLHITEDIASIPAPRATVASDAATAKMAARIGPMQGVQPSAKASPIR